MAPCGIGKKFIAELLGTFFLVFLEQVLQLSH